MQWELFPYQQEAIDKVIASFNKGNKSALVVIPTGGGKTQTYISAAKTVKDLGMAKRVMILAHRKGLVEEPMARISKFFPELLKESGIVMAQEYNAVGKNIIAASRPTVHNPARMAQILKHGPIDLLITDECHNHDNKSSREVRNMLYEANPNMLHMGVTATPRENQGHIWEDNPVNISLPWMIDNEYLVSPMWFPVQVGIDFSLLKSVKNSYGQTDYTVNSLAEVMETRNWAEIIVKNHIARADRSGPSMAFTASVAGSKLLAETFQEFGVKAMHVDGEYTSVQRKEVMNALLTGQAEVVCNCVLWTEGTDIPPIKNLHMARITQSMILYTQMIGRGLRLFPGKNYCNIFEYGDFTASYTDDEDEMNAWIGRLLKLPVRRSAVVKEGEDGNLTGLAYEPGEVKYLNGDPAEIITVQINRIKQSSFEWIGEGDDWLFLPVGKWEQDLVERTYIIPPPSMVDTSPVYAYAKWPTGKWIIKEVDDTRDLDYDDMLRVAERGARKFGESRLAERDQKWRTLPVSEGQMKYPFISQEMTRGEASRLIAQNTLRNALKQKGFAV